MCYIKVSVAVSTIATRLCSMEYGVGNVNSQRFKNVLSTGYDKLNWFLIYCFYVGLIWFICEGNNILKRIIVS